jgi:hypothetical protein
MAPMTSSVFLMSEVAALLPFASHSGAASYGRFLSYTRCLFSISLKDWRPISAMQRHSVHVLGELKPDIQIL